MRSTNPPHFSLRPVRWLRWIPFCPERADPAPPRQQQTAKGKGVACPAQLGANPNKLNSTRLAITSARTPLLASLARPPRRPANEWWASARAHCSATVPARPWRGMATRRAPPPPPSTLLCHAMPLASTQLLLSFALPSMVLFSPLFLKIFLPRLTGLFVLIDDLQPDLRITCLQMQRHCRMPPQKGELVD